MDEKILSAFLDELDKIAMKPITPEARAMAGGTFSKVRHAVRGVVPFEARNPSIAISHAALGRQIGGSDPSFPSHEPVSQRTQQPTQKGIGFWPRQVFGPVADWGRRPPLET